MSTKLVTIRIDSTIHQTARELGLNISKTCENCLKKTIQCLTNPAANYKKWTGRDLNPRPPECKSGVHTRLNYRPPKILDLFELL